MRHRRQIQQPRSTQEGFVAPFFQPVDPEDELGLAYEDTEAPKRTERAEAPVQTEDRPFG